MDIIKIFNKEKTSPNKKSKFLKIYNTKNKRKSVDAIPLKKKYSKEKENKNIAKIGLEKNILSKMNLEQIKKSKIGGIEQGTYFIKKILQIKKEINKNEFSHYLEDVNKNNDKYLKDNYNMKKIRTDLKNSLIQFKLGSDYDYDLSPKKSIKMKKSKTKHTNSNILNSGLISPKKEKKIKDNKNITVFKFNSNRNIHLNTSIKLDEDLSYGQLLSNKDNNSKLELLNKEEAKYNNNINNNNIINNLNNSSDNKSENVNKTNCSKKSNKSIKSIKSNGKKLSNEKYRKLTPTGIIYDSFDDDEEIEDQINKDFFIMPNSIFIMILDTIIALNLLYYLTYNPYFIASSTKFIFSNIFLFRVVLHFVMELSFFIDFIIQFIRAYYDFDENLVTNNKKIIFHYLGSWFLIDLIAVVPTFTIIKLYYEREKYNYGYDYICNYGCQSDNLLHLFCFLKILKVFKLMDRNENQFISLIWSHLSNSSFIDNWGNIIFEVIIAILILHITTCIHIIIGRNSYPNWITVNNLSANNFSSIYLTSLYFLITKLTSVGYGDITGNGLNEHIFQIFLLIVGIIAYSWMVSSVSNYVIENNKDDIYFSSKVSILDDIKLAHPEMDNELYNKIYLYLKQLKIMHKKKDKNILLEGLPYNLKNALLYEINKPLIEGLNFFKNFHNSVFILSAISKLIPIVTNKGDIIIEQNEIINSMVFVKQGRLGVEIAVDMNNIYNEVDSYINGTFILGEETKKKEKAKEEKYKRKNAFSLMSTFNYTMDDSFIFSKERKLDLNYKKPISFRKKLLKFMEKKFGTRERPKSMNEKKIKYIKLYYIRKGEQFGEIYMFLNKPSSFTLRVKSQKAEILLLKKIDAIEISSNYPNIWKRANKKSFKNLIHLKELVSREMIKFCDKNGIKYNPTFKLEDIKHFNSLPNLEKLKKNNKNNKKNEDFNLNKKFKKFQRNNKSFIEANKKKLKLSSIISIKDNNRNIEIKEHNLKSHDTKLLIDEDKKNESNSIKISENNDGENNIIRLTPYNEDEINSEIYKGELFIEEMKKNENENNNDEIIIDTSSFNLFKYTENNYENRKDNLTK